MPSIVLLGTGNVAHHLLDAFKDSPTPINQVFGRNVQALKAFSEHTATTLVFDEIIDADLYLLAVNDDSIKSVSEKLKQRDGLVVHTSGSISIDELQSKRKGVFYPLQTFSKNVKVNFSNVPICIEASNVKDLEILSQLASQLSNRVHEISSKQRKKLHLAAVFVNNFANHLYQIAHKICDDEDVSFELLKPLIQETANKIRVLHPKEAQTGPALRNDILTMQQHLEELKDPIHKKLYQVLSESIKRSYEKKL